MSVADLRPAAEPGNIPTADELVARARALAPKLRERAVRAERDRNIPQESVDEYLAAGLIHILQPKRWGGYEHDHEVAFNIALWMSLSGYLHDSSDMIIALADRLRLPAVYRIPQFAQRGGLSSYANDVRGGYRPAAGYVDRILKGEKPADLPVQAPTKYELELHGGRRQLAHLHAPIRPSDVPRRPAPFIPLDHSESLSRTCQSHPA